MLDVPNMLLLGSAGRNSGKTTFACALIEHLSSRHEIVAVKVTTIQERDGTCPRGGEGCGVCATLDGRFCIAEETVQGGTKDTQRLLTAGAFKVYWLRVAKEHLVEGAQALIEIIGANRLIVCESNSLRTVVEPGLFFLFRHSALDTVKASADAVRRHADRTVLWDGTRFDLELDDMGVVDGRWTFRYGAAALILAGGKSTRMGHDKALLPFRGRPLIQHVHDQLQPHFKEVIVSAKDTDKLAFLGRRIIADETPDQGPLMAIISALRASPCDLIFVVACDIPEIDIRLLRRLMRAAAHHCVDAVVPRMDESHTEPLFAVYRRSALSRLEDAFGAGVRSIREALAFCEVCYIVLEAGKALVNLNTMEDYAQLADEPPRQGVKDT